jgi:hypothetical protein
MWIYTQINGELNHDGVFEGNGYSGKGEGRDNPEMEAAPSVGPIPKGLYHIADSRTSDRLGPIVMDLDPVGHNALGRTLFRIHGDNARHDASDGCIILGRATREAIATSPDKELTVI